MNPRVVIIIILFVGLSSCETDNCCTLAPPLSVYQFKEGKDYSSNVYVLLDRTRDRIIGYPSYGDVKDTNEKIIDYYKGYYYGQGFYGMYTAFLDILIEDFQWIDDTITEKGFYGHLLDKDPFEEYYIDEDNYLANDCPECPLMDTIWPAIDTSKFHRLVDSQTIGLHLKRLI